MTTADLDTEVVTRELLPAEPSAGLFDPGDINHQPERVRRYFEASIAQGGRVSGVASLRMRGHIRIGRWLRSRPRMFSPLIGGFVWRSRAADIITWP